MSKMKSCCKYSNIQTRTHARTHTHTYTNELQCSHFIAYTYTHVVVHTNRQLLRTNLTIYMSRTVKVYHTAEISWGSPSLQLLKSHHKHISRVFCPYMSTQVRYMSTQVRYTSTQVRYTSTHNMI